MSLIWGEEGVLTQSEVIARYIELLLVEDLERLSKFLVAKEQGKTLRSKGRFCSYALGNKTGG